ncbi:hypothetical protein MN608_05949 [Microdochium nivale]|nr:hypothetical protein MN608_05949 [Microdochium nivale]
MPGGGEMEHSHDNCRPGGLEATLADLDTPRRPLGLFWSSSARDESDAGGADCSHALARCQAFLLILHAIGASEGPAGPPGPGWPPLSSRPECCTTSHPERRWTCRKNSLLVVSLGSVDRVCRSPNRLSESARIEGSCHCSLRVCRTRAPQEQPRDSVRRNWCGLMKSCGFHAASSARLTFSIRMSRPPPPAGHRHGPSTKHLMFTPCSPERVPCRVRRRAEDALLSCSTGTDCAPTKRAAAALECATNRGGIVNDVSAGTAYSIGRAERTHRCCVGPKMNRYSCRRRKVLVDLSKQAVDGPVAGTEIDVLRLSPPMAGH